MFNKIRSAQVLGLLAMGMISSAQLSAQEQEHPSWEHTQEYVSPLSVEEAEIKGPENINPMVFSIAEDCRDKCELVAVAEGDVVLRSHEALEELAKDYPQVSRVFLHSPGGNLQGGLRLGLTLRQQGMDTAISPRMRCVSACAYAFLGGVERELLEGGLLGVHRFRSVGTEAGVDAAQQVSALLVTYVEGLGLSRDILDLSARAGSNEVVGITRHQAKELGIDNTRIDRQEWNLKAIEDGQLIMGMGGRSVGSDRRMGAAVVVRGDLAVINVRLQDPPFHSESRQEREFQNFSLLMCPYLEHGELLRRRCVMLDPAEQPELSEDGELALFFSAPYKDFSRLAGNGRGASVVFALYGGVNGKTRIGMISTPSTSFENSLKALRR